MRYLRAVRGSDTFYARWLDDIQLERLSDAPWLGGVPTGEQIARPDVHLLPPVAPSKVVCVGRNYAAHARELGNEVPAEPLLFLKPPSAIITNGQAIVLPRQSTRVEHEAEIGVVIGTELRNASEAEVIRGIFGITCVNDVTARDLQRRDVQFTRAKGFDTFCPVGPFVETEANLEELQILGRVNGELRQHGHAHQMTFGIVRLIGFMSSVMRLQPGDLIATGTPEGVGPLVPGDVVEVEIPGVGTLINVVEAE
jgi:2-keto-4-pentenoate hydratase/2-oxohepta-3-ene-1,7-dioic acid hydratase in catechol pathway